MEIADELLSEYIVAIYPNGPLFRARAFLKENENV